MIANVDDIEAAALQMSAKARMRLLERLLASLDEIPEAERTVAQTWAKEAEMRDQAMTDGREKDIPATEVFEQLRSSIG